MGSDIKVALVTPSASPASSCSTISLGSSPSNGNPQEQLDAILATHGIFIPKPEPGAAPLPPVIAPPPPSTFSTDDGNEHEIITLEDSQNSSQGGDQSADPSEDGNESVVILN